MIGDEETVAGYASFRTSAIHHHEDRPTFMGSGNFFSAIRRYSVGLDQPFTAHTTLLLTLHGIPALCSDMAASNSVLTLSRDRLSLRARSDARSVSDDPGSAVLIASGHANVKAPLPWSSRLPGVVERRFVSPGLMMVDDRILYPCLTLNTVWIFGVVATMF